MLSAILEVILAVLSAVGLLFLAWLAFGRRLLAPGYNVSAVVAVRGDGAKLEQAVRGLLWLRECDLWHGRIVISDLGLDEEGRKLARLLCANGENVFLCTPDELPRLVGSDS